MLRPKPRPTTEILSNFLLKIDISLGQGFSSTRLKRMPAASAFAVLTPGMAQASSNMYEKPLFDR